MNITETITQELLDAAGDPAQLEAVFGRHRSSKGPLYAGLAQATTVLQERLKATLLETSQRKEARDKLASEVDALAGRRDQLAGEVQRTEGQLQDKQQRLAEAQTALELVRGLEKMGFGEQELDRLFRTLGHLAAEQGLSPEEGVKVFFEQADRYGEVASLALEAEAARARAASAQTEAERWEAEARRRETHSKARTATIDSVEKLLAQGAKEGDLQAWTRVVDKAGVKPEALAAKLEEYGTLERLCSERGSLASTLGESIRRAKAALAALQREQAKVQAAIASTRDGALKEMQLIARQVLQHLEAFNAEAQQYGELQRQAAGLQRELALARAFSLDDPQRWQTLPGEAARALLTGLVLWAKAQVPDPKVPVPSAVSQRNTVPSWATACPSDLLYWARTGLYAEAEKKALAARG